LLSSQSKTPDLHSNPEPGSGGGACSGEIMAMRAQRRTVIDPMYIEDADVINVSRIIMGGPEGVQIAEFIPNPTS